MVRTGVPSQPESTSFSHFRGKKSQSHNWLCIADILVRGANKKTFKIFDLFWVRFCSFGLAECHLRGSDSSWGGRQIFLRSKKRGGGRKHVFKEIAESGNTQGKMAVWNKPAV